MYKIIGGDGREYGPVSAEQLRQWIREGRANANTQAAAEGSNDWKPLASFPEFAELPTALSPPLPSASAPRPPARDVPTYLVPAILCTVFCCLPFGIVAIVYAAQVRSKLTAGDVEGALASSRNAKIWCWVSFGTSFVIGFIYLIVMVVFGLFAAAAG